MLPFELVATATDSPKYSPAGSLRKFGTAVKGMSVTPVIVAFCWATAGPATRTTAVHAEARYRSMERPPTRSDDGPCGSLFRQVRNVEWSLYQTPRRFNHHPNNPVRSAAGTSRRQSIGEGGLCMANRKFLSISWVFERRSRRRSANG